MENRYTVRLSFDIVGFADNKEDAIANAIAYITNHKDEFIENCNVEVIE